MMLDQLSDIICCFYGEKYVWGKVSMPYAVG